MIYNVYLVLQWEVLEDGEDIKIISQRLALRSQSCKMFIETVAEIN